MTEPRTSQFVGIRTWITEDLLRAGSFFYELAARVAPGPQGEPCPDCGVPTTIPLDEPCPECEVRREEKLRDEAIMASAYDAGYEAADRAREGEGSW